jgi:probable HAF family extracellular repeat protein
VVGQAPNAAGKLDAFSFKNGTLLDLGALGAESCRYCSWASAVNERGQVIGSALTATNEVHAFVWDRGTMTDLGEPGKTSWALAINERGDIVGAERPNPTGSWHGVLWTRRGHSH